MLSFDMEVRQASQNPPPITATAWGSYTQVVVWASSTLSSTVTQVTPFASGAVVAFGPVAPAGATTVSYYLTSDPATSATTTTPTSTAATASSTTNANTSKSATSSAPDLSSSTTEISRTITPSQTLGPTGSTSPIQDGSAPGLSSGAAAGLAIGMVIVGAALGFFVAFCLLRRRFAKRPQPEYVAMRSAQPAPNVDDYDGSYASAKAAAAAGAPSPISPTPTAATLANPGDALQLSHFLLDAAPDKQLAAELTSLGHLIQQHVEDHYHAQPLPPHIDVSSLAVALVETGAFSVNEASTPAQLAADPRTRRAALQHIIAKVVLGSATVGSLGQDGMGGRGLSMLPRSVAVAMAEMKPTERFRGSPEAMSLAFTRWRQLTAFLLSPERSDRRALRPSGPAISQQAREVVRALNAFLAPFIADASDSHSSSTAGAGGKGRGSSQERHLEEVVVECTKFGYTLFSQPGEFRLRFETGRNWNEVVVCPGLEKVSDDQGVRYKSSRTLLGPVTDGI